MVSTLRRACGRPWWCPSLTNERVFLREELHATAIVVVARYSESIHLEEPRAPELQKLYGDMGPTLKHATDWLTERGDSQEQREQRMETVEWAVLVFVVLGVVESVQLFRGLAF